MAPPVEFRCETCDQFFKTMDLLEEHLNSKTHATTDYINGFASHLMGDDEIPPLPTKAYIDESTQDIPEYVKGLVNHSMDAEQPIPAETKPKLMVKHPLLKRPQPTPTKDKAFTYIDESTQDIPEYITGLVNHVMDAPQTNKKTSTLKKMPLTKRPSLKSIPREHVKETPKQPAVKRTHHLGETRSLKPKRYKCAGCSEVFRNRFGLHIHADICKKMNKKVIEVDKPLELKCSMKKGEFAKGKLMLPCIVYFTNE